MWGPANALLDENISGDQQGLTPRVFERLFARINEVSLCCLCIGLCIEFYVTRLLQALGGTSLYRSKSRMQIDSSSISVTVLFLR